MKPLRFFVTATDTGVGKTEVSCALLSLLARHGERPFAFKPFESGVTDLEQTDSAKLQRAAGGWQSLDSICLNRFRAPLAPGMAARLEPKAVNHSFAKCLRAFRAFEGSGVVEGAGGLFVPLDDTHDVMDLARSLALPIIVVARAGLGTINHTHLTLEALLRRRLTVRAVVLNAATAPDASSRHNAPELRRRFPRIPVLGPVPFEPDQQARGRALRRSLRGLLTR